MAVSVVLLVLAARASALCILRNKTFCWGNEHRYVERTGSASPFEGIVGSTPAFADLDGDGDLDLVVGENHGYLYYYENVGNAASPSYEAVTGTADPFDDVDVDIYSAPALGDLDGDLDVDLVVGAWDGKLYYYENVGNAAPVTCEDTDDGATDQAGFGCGDYNLGTCGHYDHADFDSKAMCCVCGGGAKEMHEGEEERPSYQPITGTANPFDGIDIGKSSTPALADLDGDGDLDLVVGEEQGALFYYENIGSAALPSYVARTGDENPFDVVLVRPYSAPALADVDGDGDLDLVVGEIGGLLYYYENVGNATAPSYEAVAGTANPFDGINVGGFSKPAFADLDGDGDLVPRPRASPSITWSTTDCLNFPPRNGRREALVSVVGDAGGAVRRRCRERLERRGRRGRRGCRGRRERPAKRRWPRRSRR